MSYHGPLLVNILARYLADHGWPWWLLPDSDIKRQFYMRSRRWAHKKRLVHERAGGLCEWCARRGLITLGVDTHHVTYTRLYREYASDLVLLCRFHHDWVHGLTYRRLH